MRCVIRRIISGIPNLRTIDSWRIFWEQKMVLLSESEMIYWIHFIF